MVSALIFGRIWLSCRKGYAGVFDICGWKKGAEPRLNWHLNKE